VSEFRGKCAKISGTTHATAGTQTTHGHGQGTPKAVVIVPKSNGVVYLSAEPDSTNIYVKGSASSLNFDAILFY
jgi:hypothetical protein